MQDLSGGALRPIFTAWNKGNRNFPSLCWSWIVFNLNQIEDNPL
jgi:hypothetical protein